MFGYLINQKGDIPKAIEYYNKSLKIQEEIGDKKGIALSFNNIGGIYMNQGDIPKAIEYYNKSLKIQEEIGDKKGMALSFNNIGSIYNNQGDIPKALEYFNKSLKIKEEIGDKKGMAYSFNNIGFIYMNQGGIPKAIEYYNKSLKIREEIGDKQGMANSFNNIGTIYNNQASEAKSRQNFVGSDSLINKALEYFNKSLKIYEEIGDKQGIALSFNNIGRIYLIKNDISNAKSFAEKAYRLSKELGYPENINRAAGLQKKICEKQGNYKKALEYYTEEILMRDSIVNKENNKKVQKQQAKYEYEKRAAVAEIEHSKAMEISKLEIARQKAEGKRQKTVLWFTVCGLLLVLLFLGFLYRMFLQKKKANLLLARQKQQIEIQNSNLQQANEEITAQRDEIEVQRKHLEVLNEEISAQSDLVTQQKEHIEEIYHEISDSINYAKRIQQAVLPDLELLLTIGNQSADCRLPTADCEFPITDFYVLFKPKDIVSGDFYWSTRINELLIITVADCTGHGVPGAFMSMLGISFLNEIVRKKPACRQGGEVTKASEVLDELRTSVIDALKQKGESGEQKDGMDIALCAISMNTLEMQFAGANNPCWIIKRFDTSIKLSGRNLEMNQSRNEFGTGLGNESEDINQLSNYQIIKFPNLIELKGDKQPIGIHTNMQPFTNQIYQLQKGDVLYLMSDGYEDQFGGPNRKKFLSKNLKNLLTANSQQPMADQKQILETSITDWIGSGEQIDDITVLGMKI